jgi:hypothetical protein
LTHEEVEHVLNDCHLGACGIISQGWLQPKKSYVSVIFGPPYSKTALRPLKNSHPVKSFRRKHVPTQLHSIQLSPSTPLLNGVLISCNVSLPQSGGHGYIIVAVDYFTKWAEAMPTFLNDGRTATLFMFNHIIAHFRVPQAIVTDHRSHFQNQMMSELRTKLGFRHENSSPYYPQANGQVEAINKVLKTMLQCMVGVNKTTWHLHLFSSLWAYRTSVKTTTGFTPFQLVYGLEAVLSD